MNPNRPEVIKVAVVEDDARLQRTLSEVLAATGDCQCVGLFPTGRAALDGLSSLQPDVILMDINLPDLTGVECVARVAPQCPRAQILMLTVYQDTETIFRALAAGAHGYLVKPVMPEQLLEAIREIRAGGVPMSRSIARQVIEFFRRPAPSPTPGTGGSDSGLGPREQQVLDFLVAGLSYKEIANELDIKTSTVGTYVQRIYEKLHVRSRREVISYHRKTEESRAS